jgi:CBS domain-containing protein
LVSTAFANKAVCMYVNEIMTERVSFLSPDASLKDAAKRMDDLNIGALPVRQGDRLVGIVTDRDIIIRSISAGMDPNITQVRDAMTSPVTCCFEDNTVEEVARIMGSLQIRRLPVLNRSGELVGLISLDDLIADFPDKNLAAEVARMLALPIKSAA